MALGSLRYGSKNNLTKNATASTLCFTASNNQLNNCTKVFGDDADTEIIHFRAQKQDKFNNLMVFRRVHAQSIFGIAEEIEAASK